MLTTCVLQPLILGKEEKREMTRHSENLDRIKLALAGLKIIDENFTLEEFLHIVNLDLDAYILAIRSNIKTDTVFLKRSPNELRVNNFNVHCLKALRSNMDMQFI